MRRTSIRRNTSTRHDTATGRSISRYWESRCIDRAAFTTGFVARSEPLHRPGRDIPGAAIAGQERVTTDPAPDAAATYDLFAADLVATVRGVVDRGRDAVCAVSLWLWRSWVSSAQYAGPPRIVVSDDLSMVVRLI
jgi:hypothetical protein